MSRQPNHLPPTTSAHYAGCVTRTRTHRLFAVGVTASLAIGVLGACLPVTYGESSPNATTAIIRLTKDTFADAIKAGDGAMDSYRIVTSFGGATVRETEPDGAFIAMDVVRTGVGQDCHVMMTMSDQEVEAFVIGRELWMSADGETFIHASGDDAASDPDIADALEMATPTDIVTQVDGFVAAITSFEALDADVIDGVNVWGYTMTVNPARIPQAVQTMEPEQLLLINAITATYWLDADNIPRKIDLIMTGNNGLEMMMQANFTLIGEVAPITPPSAGTVVEFADMHIEA